ncbi:MAG: hypothetical protein WDN10_02065 [bacterium]
MKVTICTDIANGYGWPKERQISDRTYRNLSVAALRSRRKIREMNLELIDVIRLIRFEIRHQSGVQYDHIL